MKNDSMRMNLFPFEGSSPKGIKDRVIANTKN